MASNHWTIGEIPDQKDKLVVVTGANSGIGYETALALAGKGAHVVLAVRSEEKGRVTQENICRVYPQAHVEPFILDLADLQSVRQFAENYRRRFETLPLLISNAGVMGVPFRRTADGFEMQLGTNHLGHFALTGLLLPALLAAPHARVVNVSSSMHMNGKIDFDNLDGARDYDRWRAYCQSKLANLLFAYELQRRFVNAGVDAISIGCHPGYAATNLQFVGPQMSHSRSQALMYKVANRLVAQSAAMGALPTLYAAVAPDVAGGDYIGPLGLGKMRGYPGKDRSSARSYDVEAARHLWQVSTELTGVAYKELERAVAQPSWK